MCVNKRLALWPNHREQPPLPEANGPPLPEAHLGKHPVWVSLNATVLWTPRHGDTSKLGSPPGAELGYSRTCEEGGSDAGSARAGDLTRLWHWQTKAALLLVRGIKVTETSLKVLVHLGQQQHHFLHSLLSVDEVAKTQRHSPVSGPQKPSSLSTLTRGHSCIAGFPLPCPASTQVQDLLRSLRCQRPRGDCPQSGVSVTPGEGAVSTFLPEGWGVRPRLPPTPPTDSPAAQSSPLLLHSPFQAVPLPKGSAMPKVGLCLMLSTLREGDGPGHPPWRTGENETGGLPSHRYMLP